ncbi:hypothetical protein [Synechococcus sp. MIT S9503]|uniref:hypothetical protein n=1 Tax=Synechococcus sp. MIT S9503 TaxID=3082547 RepID=UPI0039A574F6
MKFKINPEFLPLLALSTCLFLPSNYYAFSLALIVVIDGLIFGLTFTLPSKFRLISSTYVIYVVYSFAALLFYLSTSGSFLINQLDNDSFLKAVIYPSLILAPIFLGLRFISGIQALEAKEVYKIRFKILNIFFFSSAIALLDVFNLLPFELHVFPANIVLPFAIVNRNLGSSTMDPSVYTFSLLIVSLLWMRTEKPHFITALQLFVIQFSSITCFSKPLLLLNVYALVSYLMWLVSGKFTKSFRRFLVFLIASTIFCIFFVALFTVTNYLYNYVGVDLQYSLGSRAEKWAYLLDQFQSFHFFTGIGFKAPELITGWGAHSGFVQPLIEAGAFGVFLSLIIFYSCLRIFKNSFVVKTDFLMVSISLFFVSYGSEILMSRLFVYSIFLVLPAFSFSLHSSAPAVKQFKY